MERPRWPKMAPRGSVAILAQAIWDQADWAVLAVAQGRGVHSGGSRVSKGMPPKMKAMAGSAMGKGALAAAIAEAAETDKKTAAKVLETLAEIATMEVKKNAKFTIPGLCMIKTRKKPATKAGKREMFGKVCIVKAKPAKTVVKAFPAKALKDEF